MTSNQINYFKAQEEVRAHKAQETLGWASHFVDVYNAHTQRKKSLLDYDVNLRNAVTNEVNAATKQREAEISYQNALINLQNANTRLFEAQTGRMNAETNQYAADIRLMELNELERHNIESEQLGFMNNQLGYAELNEQHRKNVASEALSQQTINENIMHNTAMEAIARQEANIKQQQYLWNVEHQSAQLTEESRHNTQTETISALNTFIKPITDLLGIVARFG